MTSCAMIKTATTWNTLKRVIKSNGDLKNQNYSFQSTEGQQSKAVLSSF